MHLSLYLKQLERTGLVSIVRCVRGTVVLDQIHSCLMWTEGERDREWTSWMTSFLFFSPENSENEISQWMRLVSEWECTFSDESTISISSVIGSNDMADVHEIFNWVKWYRRYGEQDSDVKHHNSKKKFGSASTVNVHLTSTDEKLPYISSEPLRIAAYIFLWRMGGQKNDIVIMKWQNGATAETSELWKAKVKWEKDEMRVYLFSWIHILICFSSLYLLFHRLAQILSLER